MRGISRSRQVRLCVWIVLALTFLLGLPAAAHAASFSGHVYDASTEDPLAGIQVRIYDTDVPEGEMPELINAVVTDAAGAYDSGEIAATECVIAFVDPTHEYRDLTAPGTGLPIESTYVWDPNEDGEIDEWMIKVSAMASVRPVRVSGSDRYSTAIEVSKRNFPSAGTAVIVSGQGFADALSAAPLAGLFEAPLLLTKGSGLPPGLVAELQRLEVEEIYFVGGTGVLPNALGDALVAAGLPRPIRVSGADRYDTSAQVLRKIAALVPDWRPEPFLCSGQSFPDALSAAPFAYADARPILLAKGSIVTNPVATAWRDWEAGDDDTVLVVGGTGVVGNAAIQTLANHAVSGGLMAYRFGGANRYETCAQLIDAWGGPYDAVFAASGQNFPDALAGAAAAGRNWAPIVLTPGASLATPSRGIFEDNGTYIMLAEVFGGTSVVTPATYDAIKAAIGDMYYAVDGDQDINDAIEPLGSPVGTIRRLGLEARQTPASSPQRDGRAHRFEPDQSPVAFLAEDGAR